MEPKSPKSVAAHDTAAMRRVAAGLAAEHAAKLTKPVADSKGFKSASWTAMPAPARMVTADATPPLPTETSKPIPNRSPTARVATPRTDPALAQIQHDLAEIRSMLGSLAEAVRTLQTTAGR